MGQHHHIQIDGRMSRRARIELDHLDAANHSGKATSNAVTDDATSDDANARHQRSGSSSGRHPPCWGGVPPVPFTRNTAAARTLMKIAENARRRNFIQMAG
jgi:hypothetical protein